MDEASAAPSPASTDSTPRFLSLGDGNEVLQVALAPGDSILAAERAFCYRGLGLQLEAYPANTGALGRALGWMGMKNDRVVKWTNEGTAPTYVGLAAPLPGKVIPVNLLQSGDLLAKPQMFLCSFTSNQLSASRLRLTPEGPFPQHNIDMRKIQGSGMCYIQAGGAAVQKTLGRSETMVAEIGCVAAISASCKIVAEEHTGFVREPPYTQGFSVKITGPGTVFIQSTHAGRMSRDRMAVRAGGAGGDMVKAAAITVGILVLLYALVDVEY